MNQIDFQYQNLLQEILDNGVEKETRNGKTLSIFGYQIIHDMKEGFPLLTTKKMATKSMVTELLWFLRGNTNIKYLVENGCNIWNGDAFKYYISKTNEFKGKWPDRMEDFIQKIKEDDEFAKKWGELGPIYGFQWRNWNDIGSNGDQIRNLILELKHNPNSRRLMVNAWNVEQLNEMVLPPCHYGFQCYVRDEKYLSLMWNQRSVDVPLGLPFNIASYGLLLHILAEEVNMIPDKLIGNLGDCHIYQNQKKGVIEQLGRIPYDNLPSIEFDKKPVESYESSDFKFKNYVSHPTIKFPLSN